MRKIIYNQYKESVVIFIGYYLFDSMYAVFSKLLYHKYSNEQIIFSADSFKRVLKWFICK